MSKLKRNNRTKTTLIGIAVFCVCFFLLFPYFKPLFNKAIKEKLIIKSFDELKKYNLPTYIDAPTVGDILMVRNVKKTGVSYIDLYGKFDTGKVDLFLVKYKFKKRKRVSSWLFKKPPAEVLNMFKKDMKDYFVLKGNEVKIFNDAFEKSVFCFIISDNGYFVCKIIHPYRPRL